MLLCSYPALNAFGYSHTTGAIDDKLKMLDTCYPTGERPRFAIYDSDGIHGTGIRPTASTIKHLFEDFKPPTWRKRLNMLHAASARLAMLIWCSSLTKDIYP